jgi:hypothetical protein
VTVVGEEEEERECGCSSSTPPIYKEGTFHASAAPSLVAPSTDGTRPLRDRTAPYRSALAHLLPFSSPSRTNLIGHPDRPPPSMKVRM